MPLTALTCTVFYKWMDCYGMSWPLVIFWVVQLNHRSLSSFSFLPVCITDLIMNLTKKSGSNRGFVVVFCLLVIYSYYKVVSSFFLWGCVLVLFILVFFPQESSPAMWLESNFHCIQSAIEILNVRKEIFTGIHKSRIHHDSVWNPLTLCSPPPLELEWNVP